MKEPLLSRNSQFSKADTYTKFQNNMINSIRLGCCGNIAWERPGRHLSLDLTDKGKREGHSRQWKYAQIEKLENTRVIKKI